MTIPSSPLRAKDARGQTLTVGVRVVLDRSRKVYDMVEDEHERVVERCAPHPITGRPFVVLRDPRDGSRAHETEPERWVRVK